VRDLSGKVGRGQTPRATQLKYLPNAASGAAKAEFEYIGLQRQYEMRTELISIATDTLLLDGAFYRPEAESCGAVMLFHGNAMNFYVGARAFCRQC
jgi:hypothetical protein